MKKKLKNPPAKFFKYIKKKGFLTGSSVLGGFEKGYSDIDYILKKDSFIMSHESFFTYPEQKEIPEEEHNSSSIDGHSTVYVKDAKGNSFNLILCERQEDYDVWVETTKTILKMQKKYRVVKKLCLEKKDRVTFFKMIRHHIKGEE